MPDSKPLLHRTAAQIAVEQRKGSLILDTRAAEQFASLHIRGSIHISLMGHFASWAAITIQPTRKIVLIAENTQRAQEAQNRLTRVGLEQVIGYSLPDEAEWRRQGLELATISIKRSGEVVRALQSGSSMQLIDVRSRAEWLKGHLPGAISLPLLDLGPTRRPINVSRPSLLYCHEGSRATTAASILLQDDGGAIGILIDGIEGWSALGLPLETQEKSSSS